MFAPLFQNSVRYAHTRLQGSYVPLLDGSDLIYVNGMSSEDGSDNLDQEGIVCGVGIEGNDEKRYPFSDISVRVGPLGYINSPRVSAFNLMRKPKRQDWRAGLRSSQFYKSVRTTFVEFKETEFRQSRHGILDCLFNRYPSYEETLRITQEEGRNTAFSINFMLSNSGKLFYCGYCVGVHSKKKDKPLLHKENKYLREELNSVLDSTYRSMVGRK